MSQTAAAKPVNKNQKEVVSKDLQKKPEAFQSVADQKQPIQKPRTQPVILAPDNFAILDYAFGAFSAVLPADCDYEKCLEPIFWSHVLGQFKESITVGQQDRRGATIEVRSVDNAFYAKLYVRAVLTGGLLVQCIGPAFDLETGETCPVDLETRKPWKGRNWPKTKNFYPVWNSQKGGYDIKNSDHQVVADGRAIPTAEMARARINSFEGTI